MIRFRFRTRMFLQRFREAAPVSTGESRSRKRARIVPALQRPAVRRGRLCRGAEIHRRCGGPISARYSATASKEQGFRWAACSKIRRDYRYAKMDARNERHGGQWREWPRLPVARGSEV